LETFSNIKFHEHASSWNRVDPCGGTDKTKPVVVFFSRNFANGSENKTDGFAVSLENRYTDLGSNVMSEAHAQRANVPEFLSYEYIS
jgi:hypothetical protein